MLTMTCSNECVQRTIVENDIWEEPVFVYFHRYGDAKETCTEDNSWS